MRLMAHGLPDAAPSIGVYESLNPDTDSQEHVEIWQSTQPYMPYSSYTAPTISPHGLDVFDYPPLFHQHTPFLSALSPDIRFGCETWNLCSGETVSSSETPEDFLFMHQKSHVHVDHHSAHNPCNQCDAVQPVSSSRCTDNDVPAKRSCSDGRNNLEEELSRGATSPLPIGDEQLKEKGMDSASSKLPLMPKRRRAYKKRKLASHGKPKDLSNRSDGVEGNESCDKLQPSGKPCLSKNLHSERKRRMKLKERLYSLRAIVPRISKMDKASIVGDAINYVQDLQKQIKKTEDDILALQAGNYPAQEGVMSRCGSAHVPHIQLDIPRHKILAMSVSNMEPTMHHLCIQCERGRGVLLQLTKAIESLNLELVSASLTTVRDHVLNTIIIKVAEVMKAEDFKEKLIKRFPVYGLHF